MSRMFAHTSPVFPGNDEPRILRCFVADDRSRWKLRKFVMDWFVPEHLVREQDCASGSIRNYLECVTWWERALPENPDLSDVTRETLKRVRDFLRTAYYVRSKRKGAKRYPLGKVRQAGILTGLRTILFYAGQGDLKREAAGILDAPPHISVPKVEVEPKDCFTRRNAKLIVAACERMDAPHIKGVDPAKWNYALVCGFVFTGLRRETVRKLRWSKFQERGGKIWLRLRNEDIEKTGKGTRIRVHAELWQALQAIRTDSEFVFSIDKYQTRPRYKGGKRPWLSGDRIYKLTLKLQELAGIPKEEWLTPQAWRRTHIDWLVATGYDKRRKLGQAAADHGDSDTTETHYVDFKNQCRWRLPWLRPELKPRKSKNAHRPPDDARQRHLFD